MATFQRRDVAHANPAHRPTDEEYRRYFWLVQHFRGIGWDNSKLHDASPFRIADPGFNAILIRSCLDLAALADDVGEPEIASASRAFAQAGIAAVDALWSETRGQYLCLDRMTGTLIDSPSIGGLLAAFCSIPERRAIGNHRRRGSLSCAKPSPGGPPNSTA